MTSKHTYHHDDPVPTPTVSTPPDTSGLPAGYEPQPYPKAVYQPDGSTKTVNSKPDEDIAEQEGFTLDVPPEALGSTPHK